MYGKMIPGDPWSDDGGNEWCVLVTGEDATDHLFTVYGDSPGDAEKKASHVVNAIITYESAMAFTRGHLPQGKTEKPLDAQGIDLTHPRLHYGKVVIDEGETFHVQGPNATEFG